MVQSDIVTEVYVMEIATRLVVIAALAVPLSLAQMGNGGMGGGSTGNAGVGNGMTRMAGTMSGGMGDMMLGPTVGPDGTAYVVRTSNSSQGMMSNQTPKAELVAINPSSGKASWSLSIGGAMASEPALSKDGLTIFMTTSEAGFVISRSGTSSGQKPALLIIANSSTSARIQNKVEIDADILSAPRLTPDGQTVYVIAMEMPQMSGQDDSTVAAITSTLYAFSPSGALKFKMDLGQVQMGRMGR